MHASHSHRTCAWLLSLAALALAATARAEAPAATVKELEGKAYAVSAVEGRTRTLALEGGVGAGDRIVTGAGSGITLLFADRTRVELGENAIFRIDDYAYTRGGADTDVAGVSVLKGAFRYVSGLIAKKRASSVRVGLTVATIGIRGTHVVGEVQETSARVALMDAYYTTLADDPFIDQEELVALAEDEATTAIEVSNDYGAVVIDQPGWGTEIPDAFSPPSPPRKLDLQPITRQLRSVQTMRRVIAPRPPPIRMH